uniref:Uncharacterized protein n=1 Tax=Tetranychus urticae TaxID=32264 RepID=T1K711_TETUR
MKSVSIHLLLLTFILLLSRYESRDPPFCRFSIDCASNCCFFGGPLETTNLNVIGSCLPPQSIGGLCGAACPCQGGKCIRNQCIASKEPTTVTPTSTP